MTRSDRRVLDYLGRLDERARLRVVEDACSYRETPACARAQESALLDASYSDENSFKAAVAAAVAGASRDERLKRLSDALFLPLTLDVLAKLWSTCLLDRVEAVLVCHRGLTILRFHNTAHKPTAKSCSLLLSLSRVRAIAGTQPTTARPDLVTPTLLAGGFMCAIAAVARM
jgi:hypothetical protein